jgi:hypothetical protein
MNLVEKAITNAKLYADKSLNFCLFTAVMPRTETDRVINAKIIITLGDAVLGNRSSNIYVVVVFDEIVSFKTSTFSNSLIDFSRYSLLTKLITSVIPTISIRTPIMNITELKNKRVIFSIFGDAFVDIIVCQLKIKLTFSLVMQKLFKAIGNVFQNRKPSFRAK